MSTRVYRQQGLYEHAGAVLVYLLLCLVFYPDVVFFGRTLQTQSLVPSLTGIDDANSSAKLPVLDPGASGWQYEPWTYQIHRAYSCRELPLWNAHAALGQPLAANGLSGAFVPMRLPLLMFPSPLHFDLFLLARVVFASIASYFFLRRIAVGWLGALVGGGLFGFCDYFVLHVNMTHLDVEILLPAVMLAADRLACRPDSRAIAFGSVVVFLLLLGGNPESVALILLAGAAYALLRADARTKALAHGAISIAIGIGLAAPLLLPTLELLNNSAHAHTSAIGLVHHELKTAAVLLVPEIRSLLRPGSIMEHPQLRWGGMGAAPWIVAAVALLPLGGRSRWHALFFAATLAVCLLKVFGVPPVQWIGQLPLLDLIVYPKYLQPIIALSVSVLVGIGIDRVSCGGGRRTLVLAAAGALVATALILPATHGKAVEVGSLRNVIHVVAIELALIVAIAVLVIGTRQRATVLALGLVIVVMAGLRLHVPSDRPARTDPIEEAPSFVARLAAEPHPSRLFGWDGVLHPNWAGAFGISDIRCLDALTVGSSMTWIRRFVQPVAVDRFTGLEPYPPNVLGSAIDVAGVGLIASRMPIEDHVTRFLASRNERLLGTSDKDTDQANTLEGGPSAASITVSPSAHFECRVAVARGAPALRAHIEAVSSGEPVNYRIEIEPLGPQQVLLHERPTIGPDDTLSAAFQSIRLPEGIGYLEFIVDSPSRTDGKGSWVCWLDPRLKPGPPLVEADLAGFRLHAPPGLYASESSSSPALPRGIFQRDPTILRKLINNVDGRSELVTFPFLWSELGARGLDEAPDVRIEWREQLPAQIVWQGTADSIGSYIEVPLNQWAGHFVLLRLVSEEGSTEWSEFGIELFRKAFEPLAAIEGEDVKLYRNTEALPRALFVAESVYVGTEDAALDWLRNSTFDPRQTVVLEAESTQGVPLSQRGEGTARILRYGSSEVEIEVEASSGGTLLLLDAHYPGWKAFVDGLESRIDRANAAFRGVAVPAGRHVVLFEYSPESFLIGVIAAIAAGVLLACFVWRSCTAKSQPSRQG